MKKYKQITYGLLISIVCLMGCKDYQDSNTPIAANPSWNKSLSILPGELINTFFNEDIGSLHAIQLFVLTEPIVNYGINYPNLINYSTMALGMYNVNGSAGEVDYVKCNNNQLDLVTNLSPLRYLYKWNKNQGPHYNDPIYWESSINNEVIYDTVEVPGGFGNLSFSTDSLDLSTGGNIIYSNSTTGDVYLGMAFTKQDTVTGNILGTEYRYLKTVPDNGIIGISAQELSNLNLPGNVLLIEFHLAKGNMKVHEYDNGNKQLANFILIERAITLRIK